jgi:hypothetical protein
MKTRSLIPVLGLALALAGGSGGCSSAESQKAAPDESTGNNASAQLIAATGTIMAWPVGPIAWDGLVGTWPIAIWSPAAIGGLAFDIAGVTGLGITCAGFPGLIAAPITTPWLTAFGFPVVAGAGIGAPFLGAAGLWAPAYGFAGTYAPFADGLSGFSVGAFAPWGGWSGTLWNGALTPGWGAWMSPALTANALMFSNIAAMSAAQFMTFNVTFTASSFFAASTINNMALSIFATPITATALAASTAAIPFMSMAFPIMAPLGPLTVAPLAF